MAFRPWSLLAAVVLALAPAAAWAQAQLSVPGGQSAPIVVTYCASTTAGIAVPCNNGTAINPGGSGGGGGTVIQGAANAGGGGNLWWTQLGGTLPAFAATPTVTVGNSLSITSLSALVAGSALIGKVGIDQTTPGTTNGVSVTNFPGTQPVSIATLPSLAAGAALVGKFGIDQTTPGTTNAVAVSSVPALVAGSAIVGKFGIDQTTPGTTNAVALATLPSLAAGSALVGKVGIDQTTQGTTNAVVLAPNVQNITYSTVTVGVTSAQALAAATTTRTKLYIMNPSGRVAGTTSTNVFCVFSGTATVGGGLAVFGNGDRFETEAGDVIDPRALNCIASASVNISIGVVQN